MSHYDSCRDAEEELHAMSMGVAFRDLVKNSTDKDLGNFVELHAALLDLALALNGNAKQHRNLQSIQGRLEVFFKRMK
jgi:hypothetical protein